MTNDAIEPNPMDDDADRLDNALRSYLQGRISLAEYNQILDEKPRGLVAARVGNKHFRVPRAARLSIDDLRFRMEIPMGYPPELGDDVWEEVSRRIARKIEGDRSIARQIEERGEAP